MNRNSLLHSKLQAVLTPAGITINGTAAYDPQVHDERFYAAVIGKGSLGLGEGYMDRWWDVEALDEFFYKILKAGIDKQAEQPGMLLPYIKSLLINEQDRLGSRKVATQHYNLSPELYLSFLDPYNQYTCCYFPDGDETLDEAAIKKLHLICRKLQLQPGEMVLDIGCGWGGFAKFAAEHYGAYVTGVSIAQEQIDYARKFTEGLPIDFILADYRDIKGSYDKVLVCGMIEHVGYKNYSKLMQVVHNSLRPGGLFLLQTIGRNDTSISGDEWIRKYIFPNSTLPSMKQLSAAAEQLFVIEDVHNFGTHYYHTLMAWHSNFERNKTQLQKTHPEYDDRFCRMWRYYLLSCAGAFKAREIQLWQLVFSKGINGGYASIR